MTVKNHHVILLAVVCALIAAVYLSILLLSPPPPIPKNASPVVFSAERAIRDLETIAQEPHPMGVSRMHAEVRDYLLKEIRILDLEPQVQDTFGVRVFSGAVLGGFVENILVRLPGTDPQGTILLIAHYDSTPGGPGGVDSGSGVVTILEILRALKAGPRLRQDVIVLFSDGEEPGTLGAHAFIAQHPWFEDVSYVINMDQFLKGPPAVFRTSQGNAALVQALASSATRPAYMSLPFDLFPGGDTDLVPFMLAGVPGADVASGGSYPEKHTLMDRPELVDPAGLQMAGDQMLALVREIGVHSAFEFDSADLTFFPILGVLVHYPESWAFPLAVAAGLIYVSMLFYGLRIKGLTWGGLGIGFLAYFLNLFLSIGIGNLLWLGIQALHPEYQYSSVRAHLSGDHLYAIGFIFLALSICILVINIMRKYTDANNLASGALVVWFPGAIASAVLVPETSYLASWGLLVGSLAILFSLFSQQRTGLSAVSWLGYLISAILAIFLWVPVAYNAFLGAGFPMLNLLVGLAAILLGALIPVLDHLSSSKRWLFTAASLFVSLGFLIPGHFLVGRDSPPALVNSVGYWLDAESGQAHWIAFIGGYRTDAVTTSRIEVAFPKEMDERQTRLLTNPVRQIYSDIFEEAPPFSVLTSPAPALDLAGPHLEVVEDFWRSDRRMICVRISASMQDRLYVIISGEARLLAVTLPKNERIELPAYEDEFVLRLDGMPAEAIEIFFEIDTSGQFKVLLVEEKTGLPSFPNISTRPEPGTMRSPGEFYQGDATDFTAINRNYLILSVDP